MQDVLNDYEDEIKNLREKIRELRKEKLDIRKMNFTYKVVILFSLTANVVLFAKVFIYTLVQLT